MTNRDSSAICRNSEIEEDSTVTPPNVFILEEEKFSEFETLVDTPLESTEKLERLAERPSVFTN